MKPKFFFKISDHIIDGHHLADEFCMKASAEIDLPEGHEVDLAGKRDVRLFDLFEFMKTFPNTEIPDIAHQFDLVGKAPVKSHFDDMGLLTYFIYRFQAGYDPYAW